MDFKKNFFGFMAFTILRENKYLILTLVTAVFHRVQSLFSMTDGNDCESLATAALSVITSNFTIFIIYSAFLYNLQNNCGGGENNSYF